MYCGIIMKIFVSFLFCVLFFIIIITIDVHLVHHLSFQVYSRWMCLCVFGNIQIGSIHGWLPNRICWFRLLFGLAATFSPCSSTWQLCMSTHLQESVVFVSHVCCCCCCCCLLLLSPPRLGALGLRMRACMCHRVCCAAGFPQNARHVKKNKKTLNFYFCYSRSFSYHDSHIIPGEFMSFECIGCGNIERVAHWKKKHHAFGRLWNYLRKNSG